ncbi:MAG: hypothetical protein WA890_29600 [Micromonospora sp.]
MLRTDSPDGYASVSLVDISYLGVGPEPVGDRRLLNAPLLPFDGMNERGLAVGLAADDRATARPVPGRPTVGSVRIFVDGTMRAQRGRGSWQALTNVPVVGVPERQLRQDHRYGVIAAALDRADGVVDAPAALAVLDAARQPHTRWSVTYVLRTGEVRLVTATGGRERRYRLTVS